MATRPPKPFLPGLVRFAIHGVWGQPTVNIFHAMNSGVAWTNPDLLSAANTVFGAYKAHLIQPFATIFQVSSCDAVDLSSATAQAVTVSGTGGGSDAGVGADPAQVACCISWLQPLHYRGGHPRTYMPGIRPGDRQDSKTFTSTFTSQVQSAAAAFMNAINTSGPPGMSLGFVRYPWNPATGTWGTPAFYAYTGVKVNARVDSQRRRLGK